MFARNQPLALPLPVSLCRPPRPRRVLLAVALLAAGFSPLSVPNARGELPTNVQVQVPGRTISSNGDSMVYVVPDEAIVGFGVESFDTNLDKAKALNDEASSRLVKAVKALGIEDKHVQADTLTVTLSYRDPNHPTHGIEGYYARRSYSVTLKDIKLLEKLTDAVLKNGANQLSGFEYRTTELRKHRDQARKMAIKAAREKAEALADELGCKVGPPRTIGEASYGFYGNAYRWGGNGYNMMQNSMQANPGAAGEGGGETMPLGQIGINATVAVTFDLIAPEQGKPEGAVEVHPAKP